MAKNYDVKNRPGRAKGNPAMKARMIGAMDNFAYRNIGYPRHPEVTAEQKLMAWLNSLAGFVLPVLGGWLGWRYGVEYLKPLVERWGWDLNEVPFDQIIPLLKLSHLDVDLICRLAGLFLGGVTALIVCGMLDLFLQLGKMLPAPIPRARDEVVDEDWALELQPDQGLPPEPSEPEVPPEVEAVLKNADGGSELKAHLLEWRNLTLRYLWRREGFAVTIHCRNSFLFRSLRRKHAPQKMTLRLGWKNSRSSIRDINVIEGVRVHIAENRHALWSTASNDIVPWQMTCQTDGDKLTLSFRLHPGFLIVFWGVAVLGLILPIILLAPALWLVPAILLAVLLGALQKEPEEAQRVFTRRLRKIESAYAQSIASGSTKP